MALARLVLCSQVPFPAPAPLLLVSTKCSSVLSSQIKRPIATGTSSRWARQGTDRTGTPSDLGRPRPAWFHSRASLFLFFLDNRPPTPDKRHLPVRNCPASFLFSVLFFKYLCLLRARNCVLLRILDIHSEFDSCPSCIIVHMKLCITRC